MTTEAILLFGKRLLISVTIQVTVFHQLSLYHNDAGGQEANIEHVCVRDFSNALQLIGFPPPPFNLEDFKNQNL